MQHGVVSNRPEEKIGRYSVNYVPDRIDGLLCGEEPGEWKPIYL
jgi:hypothetical protein